MKILFDTNIIIDYLQKRNNYDSAHELIIRASKKEFSAYITAKSYADIHYLVKHNTHDEKNTRNTLNTLAKVFRLIDTTENDCIFALASKINDYEDAIMDESGYRAGVDYIVSGNYKDFKEAKCKVLKQSEMIEVLNSR